MAGRKETSERDCGSCRECDGRENTAGSEPGDKWDFIVVHGTHKQWIEGRREKSVVGVVSEPRGCVFSAARGP